MKNFRHYVRQNLVDTYEYVSKEQHGWQDVFQEEFYQQIEQTGFGQIVCCIFYASGRQADDTHDEYYRAIVSGGSQADSADRLFCQ